MSKEWVKIQNISNKEITEIERAKFIEWAKVNNGFKYYKILSTFTKTNAVKPPEAIEAEEAKKGKKQLNNQETIEE